MKLDTMTFVRTTPIHERATKDVLLEAGPEHVAALTELVAEGDEDAWWLLLAMWAEHLALGGENVGFVLNGTAMMPHVYTALGGVIDMYGDLVAGVDKLIDATNVPVVHAQLPGETRVEAVSVTREGVMVTLWVLRNDVEVIGTFDTAEEANAAYAPYAPVPPPPPPQV
jgi:hypothetical protein